MHSVTELYQCFALLLFVSSSFDLTYRFGLSIYSDKPCEGLGLCRSKCGLTTVEMTDSRENEAAPHSQKDTPAYVGPWPPASYWS